MKQKLNLAFAGLMTSLSQDLQSDDYTNEEKAEIVREVQTIFTESLPMLERSEPLFNLADLDIEAINIEYTYGSATYLEVTCSHSGFFAKSMDGSEYLQQQVKDFEQVLDKINNNGSMQVDPQMRRVTKIGENVQTYAVITMFI